MADSNKSHLPLEIIEIILSRLPSSSLLRFKTVSKSWNNVISDPLFVRNHHHRHRSKDWNSKNLFLLQKSRSEGFSLVKLEQGRKLQTLQTIQGPNLTGAVLCFCQGMILITVPHRYFALWNPSTQTHTELMTPIYSAEAAFGADDFKIYSGEAAFGICRDPITDDFKVVAVDRESHYVYSCTNKSWMKKFNTNIETKYTGYGLAKTNPGGVSVDGATYWVRRNYENVNTIMYFDPRDDELKILHKPEKVQDMNSIYLVDLRGSLCMYCCKGRDETRVQIWEKEKGIDNHSWNELMTIENVETAIHRFRPQCLVGHKIVIQITRMRGDDDVLVVYSPCKKRFKEFKDTEVVYGLRLVPYMDTLFFPIENSSQVKTGPIDKPTREKKRKRKWVE